eukprot:Nk52_evm9s490 gene=Nk52_evmTU9s490
MVSIVSSSKAKSKKEEGFSASSTKVENESAISKSAEEEDTIISKKTFAELGVCESLCEACEELGFKFATKIQEQSIPVALEGRDVIGLAETGSGKTASFALPILQNLLDAPQPYFALCLAPTRELAFQIAEQFDSLGAGIGIRTATIVGGIDMMAQAISLSKKPHVIIATPGRIIDHLENTKGFSLRTLKYLVMDEADRILNLDFEEEIDKLLKIIPTDRRTFLFSATMTSKVAKLQRASLVNPVKVEVSTKYTTVTTLVQQYLFVPLKYKDCYLAYVLNELAGNSTIIFTTTCSNTQRVTLMLRNLGFPAISLHGQMSQPNRLGALNKFKSQSRSILIATDVASRGLDIPHVDLVVNFDIPQHSKDYIHRVGRTARAGRAGRSITFVSQYDVELFQRIEKLTGKRMDLFPSEENEVLLLLERVNEAQRYAMQELRDGGSSGDAGNRHKRRNAGAEGDDEDHGSRSVGGKSYKSRSATGGGGGRGKKFKRGNVGRR